MSPSRPVGSYPAFSPLPRISFAKMRGGCFLSHCLYPRKQLPVRKYDALCCPDFPHAVFLMPASDRPPYCLLSYKVNTFCRIWGKIPCYFPSYVKCGENYSHSAVKHARLLTGATWGAGNGRCSFVGRRQLLRECRCTPRSRHRHRLQAPCR